MGKWEEIKNIFPRENLINIEIKETLFPLAFILICSNHVKQTQNAFETPLLNTL